MGRRRLVPAIAAFSAFGGGVVNLHSAEGRPPVCRGEAIHSLVLLCALLLAARCFTARSSVPDMRWALIRRSAGPGPISSPPRHDRTAARIVLEAFARLHYIVYGYPMRTRKSYWMLCGALSAALAAAGPPPLARAGEEGAGLSVTETYPARVAIPVANPLRDSDANTAAWHAATTALNGAVRAAAGRLYWSESYNGRIVEMVLMGYCSRAASYYSHETAHQFNNAKRNQHFFVDLTDWGPLVPSFRFNHWSDFWSDEEIASLVYESPDLGEPAMARRIVLRGTNGMCQTKLNAQYAVHRMADPFSTSIDDAIPFLMTHCEDLAYIAYDKFSVSSPQCYSRDRYRFCTEHDVDNYIARLNQLGIFVSQDRWLFASALSFLASAHTWSAGAGVYRYGASGLSESRVLRRRLADRVSIAMPDFYLMPSERGLFLNAESFLGPEDGSGVGAFLSLGAGLDALGMARTGRERSVRAGARYRRLGVPFSAERMTVEPFAYATFGEGMKLRGHSAGIFVALRIAGRLSAGVRLEHSRNDFLEYTIKDRDEGFSSLAALEIDRL